VKGVAGVPCSDAAKDAVTELGLFIRRLLTPIQPLDQRGLESAMELELLSFLPCAIADSLRIFEK